MSRHKNVSRKRRAMLMDPKRVTFTQALEAVVAGVFVLDLRSEVPPETQLANFKAERPLLHASRHVRDRLLAATLAKPREAKKPRLRRKRRAQAQLMQRVKDRGGVLA
jgi:hypothetical protein